MSNSFFVTSWIVACQALLSMGFSRQEYWTGFPFPPPGDLLNPGVEPVSPTLATRFFTTDPPGKSFHIHKTIQSHLHDRHWEAGMANAAIPPPLDGKTEAQGDFASLLKFTQEGN